jgi:arylsulfatase A-like enzyme
MPKNVLLIIADEFRADCLGAAGNRFVRTPNLDALAADGVLFEKCFVQATPCGPSRMCLFTGRYLCSTGALDNETPLIDAEDNLAMHARHHGASPAIMGYNDYAVDPRTLPPDDPRTSGLTMQNFLPGFDVVLDHEHDSEAYFDYLRGKGYPEALCGPRITHEPNVPDEGPGDHLPLRYPAHFKAEDSPGQFFTSEAIDYMTGRRDNSWLLSLNYIKPHGPDLCPAPYNDMYDPAEMPPAVRCPEERNGEHPYLRRFALNGNDRLVDERDLRETRACYYGMVTELDACLGRLFQALKDSGQWDNTLIVFTSDHGSHVGDHFMVGKAHYFDSAVRVPLIVRDPSPEADATRGRSLDVFCESIDVAPTVCEFLGMPPHERFQGRSVLGQVRGEPEAMPRERIHYEFYYHYSLSPEEKAKADLAECRLWVVRDDRFKYVQSGEETIPPMLFDLHEDPGEFHNLAGDPEHAATVAEYCQHLIRWRIRNEDTRMERWTQQYR